MSSIEPPSETSPLLSKAQQQYDTRANQTNSNGNVVQSGSNSESNLCDHNGNINDNENGGDIERQDSNGNDTQKQQGLPDVKAKMKYIFPAIAIGVRACS